MNKLVVLAILLAVPLSAQPTFVKSPFCPSAAPCVDTDYSTHTSVRILWKTTEATDRAYIRCGLAGYTTAAVEHDYAGANVNDTIGRYMKVEGLAPGRDYECEVGVSLTSDTATHTRYWYPARIAYTTPARPAGVWDPIPDPLLPTTAYPAITGSTFPVLSDCSNLQSQINAAAAASPTLTHEVVIPAGTHCVGNYKITNHKDGPGYLVIRSSAVGTTTFPPEGVRVVPGKNVALDQFAWIDMPQKTPGWQTATEGTDSGIYSGDKSSYIRLVGIATEPQPTKNNWVYKDGTCTVTSGQDILVNISASGAQNHNLLDGRAVKVLSAATISGLPSETPYTMASTGGTTFTLNDTAGIAGTQGTCRVAVLADADLTACSAGTGGAIRCTTNVPHGLVTNTVVKVIGDISYGFSGRTSYVDVIDANTIEFRGTTAVGTYAANSARVIMDGSIYLFGIDFWGDSTTNRPTNIVLDRVYIHHPGPPFKGPIGIRMACDSCAVVESYIEANGQWVFTVPGTTKEQRSVGYTTNGTNVNSDWALDKFLFRNNYLAYHLIGVAGSSTPSATYPPQNQTHYRNTIEYPEAFRKDLNNPVWDGLSYEFNRQGAEYKGVNGVLFRGNRFYGTVSGQDVGNAVVFASRASSSNKTNRTQKILFEYNTVASGANVPIFSGSSTNDTERDVPIGNRGVVRHNIFNIDGLVNYAGRSGNGACLYFSNLEDYVFERNLCVNRGIYQPVLYTHGQNSGVKIRNNIFVYHHGPQAPIWKYANYSSSLGNNEWWYPDGVVVYPSSMWDGWGSWVNSFTAIGQATPVTVSGTSYPYLDATSEFRNNVLITGTKTTTPSCDASTSSTCNALKSDCETTLGVLKDNTLFGGNVCWDGGQSIGATGADTYIQRLAKAGILKLDRTVRYTAADDIPAKRRYDFHLNYSSPFKSGVTSSVNSLCTGGLCIKATDGSDLGPDIDKLESVQGLVKNARVIGTTSTTAQLGYLAPDADVCSVDYWKGTDTPSRVSDSGGARNRAVTLSSLTAGAAYHYIIQCAVEQPSGIFVTRP